MGNCFKKQYKYKQVIYEDVKTDIKPFDLIVFRGTGIISDTIRLLEGIQFGNDEWTHVGVIITTDIIPIKNGLPNKLYIWESVASVCLPIGDGVKSVETKEGFIGVQIRDLEQVININYDIGVDTMIGWCKLENNPIMKKLDENNVEYHTRVERIKTVMRCFYEENNGTPFPLNPIYMLPSLFPELEKLRVLFKNKGMFCSQFATSLYLSLGLIDKKINPADITPVEILGIHFPKIFKLPPIVFKKNEIKQLTTITRI